jgi:hypothetical protein
MKPLHRGLVVLALTVWAAVSAFAAAAAPIEVKLDVSRLKFSTKDDTSNTGYTVTTEQWGYDIALTSKTMRPATEIRVEYQLYIRQAKLGQTPSSQPLKNRPGTKTIAKLDAGGKSSFKTDSAAARQVKLLPGYVWKETGRGEDVSDKLEGIWVRVFQGTTMIAEYASSETFKKGGWPVEPKAGK